MEEDLDKSTNRCHVCGNCWKMFINPQELQEHCLKCFQSGNEKISIQDIQNKENTLNGKDCDVIGPKVTENNYPQFVNESLSNFNETPTLTEDYYSFFTNQGDDSSYECKICGKVFTNYGSYRRHLRMHITGKSHICGECGKRYFRRYLLIQHAEKAHGGTRQSLRLCHCGLWFRDIESLKVHNQDAHNKGPLEACGLPLQRLRYSRKKKVDTPNYEINSNQNQTLFDGQMNNFRQTENEMSPNPFNYNLPGKKNASQSNGMCWLCTICSKPLRNREEVLAHRKVCYPMANNSLPRKRRSPNNMFDTANKLQKFQSESIICDNQDFPCDLSNKEGSMSPMSMETSKRSLYVCELCRKTFINRSSYLRHLRMHTGVKPCVCEFCCMSFFRNESLTTHKKKYHYNLEYRCCECGHKANNAFSLREHFYSHMEDNDVPVDQVQSSVVNKDLRTDKKILTPNQSETHKSDSDSYISALKEDKIAGYCKICQKQFYKIENYNRHMKLHKNSFHATQWYTCRLCGKVSLSHKDHQDHLKLHSSMYTCSNCTVCFQTEEMYNNHMKECMKGWSEPKHIEPEKQHNVSEDSVEEIVRDEEEIKSVDNSNAVYNDSKWYSSASNELSDKNPATLMDEHKSTESPDSWHKTYVCRICVRKFTNQASFRRHMRMHKGKWIHSCRYCGKYFFRKDHLQHHESSRHFGMEKNGDIFCCYYCSVCYPDSNSLKEHVTSSHKVPSHCLQSSWDETAGASNEATDYYSDNSVYCNSESDIEDSEVSHSLTNVEHKNRQSAAVDYSSKNIISKNVETDDMINNTRYLLDDTDKSTGMCNGDSVNIENGNYKCIRCPLIFQSMTEMFTHLREAHGLHKSLDNTLDGTMIDDTRRSQGSYKQCSRCHRQFSTHNSLLSHLCIKAPSAPYNNVSAVNGEPSQKYSCNLCLKEYNDVHMLDAHKQLAHVVMDMYECKVCHYKGSQETIQFHMMSHVQKCGTFVSTIETYPHDQEEQIMAQTKARMRNETNYSSQHNELPLLCQQLTSPILQKPESEKETFHPQAVPVVGDAKHNFYFNNWNARNDYNIQEKTMSPDWTNDQAANSLSISQYPSSEVEEITVEPSLDILTIAAEENADSEKPDEAVNMESGQSPVPDEEDDNDNESEVSLTDKPKRPRAIVLFQRGKRIYKCEECDRVFINYSSCKRHRRQHSGIWKHGCTICGRVFFRKDQRDKHLKSHSMTQSTGSEC